MANNPTGTCSLVQHIAGDIVNAGWTKWGSYAQDALDATEEFFTDIQELEITPVLTNIDFSVPAELGVPFAKPIAPTDPNITFGSVSSPGDVDVQNVVLPSFDDAPENTAVAPTITLPNAPAQLDAEVPNDAPTASVVTIPDAPVITLPTEPTLQSLTLPSVPTVSLPTFTGTLPVNTAVSPGNTFDFEYEDYTTQMPTLVSRIQEMLAGGTGLPAAIWNALWEKARGREDKTAAKAIAEVTDEWASRGFSLPGGVLDKNIQGVRQDNQDASNQLSRDIAIEQAKMEVENMRFAVSQGIAFEGQYLNLHMQEMQLAYETAKYTVEAAISVYNAQISAYNVELQVYIAETQVHRTLIEAEMANVELYKAQLEGQKLIGDINQQDIDLYTARIGALLSEIEIYKGELDGVRTLVEVDKTQVESFTARVGAFEAQVRANESEVKAYSARVAAEMAKAEIYSTEIDAFTGLVTAYKTGNEAQIAAKRLEIENNGFKLEKFRTKVAKYSVDIDAEAKRVASGVGIYEGQTRMYAAELGAEQARVVADSRQYDLALETAKSQTQIELAEASMNIEQVLRTLNLELDKNKTILTVQAQLAAAAMSAVNLSASISEQAQNSSSCSTNNNYSY
jgi:hypothetical protein